jgi:hypothetical protein
MHAGRVKPGKEWLLVTLRAINELERAIQDFLVNGFHPLLVERTSILAILLAPFAKARILYYYEEHDYLPSLVTIMQHAGAIYDVSFNNVPRYNFTEDFVTYLIGDTPAFR